MRRLRLLGPVQVDWNQSESTRTGRPVAGEIPRFRSRRTVALLGYLVGHSGGQLLAMPWRPFFGQKNSQPEGGPI